MEGGKSPHGGLNGCPQHYWDLRAVATLKILHVRKYLNFL